MSEASAGTAAPGQLGGQVAAFDETPELVAANPQLTETQISSLAAYGERRDVAPGEVLFRAGDSWTDIFVVLAGKVAIIEGYRGPDERLLVVHGAGRFLGELSVLTGQPGPNSVVVAEPGEVLAVPVERLGDLLARDTVVGDLILGTCLIRRSMLISHGIGMRIIGSRYSPDVRRLRDFATRNRLPYRWLDLEEDPGTESLLARVGVAPEDTPMVILFGNQLLRNPSNAALAAAIGLPTPAQAETVSDLIVVGAGPAGLSAAVYGASEGLITLTLDAVATGGQAGTSTRIENYLGFPTGISGAELAERAVRSKVPEARPASHGGVREHECLLRGHAGGSAAVPRRSGRDRGQRQFRRAGRAIPGQLRRAHLAAGP